MMGTPMLTCEELVELVTDYLEDAMSAAERARFEEHLADCDGCTAYVEQMRETIAVAGSIDATTIDDGMRARLLDAFQDWRSS